MLNDWASEQDREVLIMGVWETCFLCGWICSVNSDWRLSGTRHTECVGMFNDWASEQERGVLIMGVWKTQAVCREIVWAVNKIESWLLEC